MKIVKKIFANYFLLSIVCIALGLALIIAPDFFTNAISYSIGGVSVAFGVIEIIKYANKNEDKDENIAILFRGIVFCAIGLFLILRPDFIFKIISTAFGLYMLISGVINLMDSKKIKRSKGKWQFSYGFSAATVIMGIVILFNPLAPERIMLRLLGIALLVSGITNLTGTFKGKRELKKFVDIINKNNNDKDKFIDI